MERGYKGIKNREGRRGKRLGVKKREGGRVRGRDEGKTRRRINSFERPFLPFKF